MLEAALFKRSQHFVKHPIQQLFRECWANVGAFKLAFMLLVATFEDLPVSVRFPGREKMNGVIVIPSRGKNLSIGTG